jgi:predicted RNase H-like nuclease
MRATIVGIDCAVDYRNIGLALGSMEQPQPRIVKVEAGSRVQSDAELVELIARWIPESGPILISLDAPLGWPTKLGEVLPHHSAGRPINECPNKIFRRLTDCVVKEKIGRQPLDIGADRIARTAHAALALLQRLREITGQAIPLAWNPAIRDGLSVIEVYPAATLTVHGIQASSYKRKNQEEERKEIVGRLGKYLALPSDTSLVVSNADVLDAVVCILAAADFLLGKAIQPTDRRLAEKEGWIWVRNPR